MYCRSTCELKMRATLLCSGHLDLVLFLRRRALEKMGSREGGRRGS